MVWFGIAAAARDVHETAEDLIAQGDAGFMGYWKLSLWDENEFY